MAIGSHQLRIFIFCSFVFKNLDSPGGHINDLVMGKALFHRSQILEGLFELTQRPSRALDSPSALLPELHRNKNTVRVQR